jgi:5'-nucleotidase / UDP-sugar diphosphatase
MTPIGPSGKKFDVVTAIEVGDFDRGYRAIDISGKDERLYSLTCPLMIGVFVVAIPTYTKGKLTLVPKNREGQPLKSKVEALDDPRSDTPDLLAPAGMMDQVGLPTVPGKGAVREIRNGRRSWITSAAFQ